MCYPTYAFVHSELCLLIFNVATSWAWKHFIVLTGSVSHNSKVPRRPVFTVLRMGMVCALTVQKLEGAHLSTAILENVPWVVSGFPQHVVCRKMEMDFSILCC